MDRTRTLYPRHSTSSILLTEVQTSRIELQRHRKRNFSDNRWTTPLSATAEWNQVHDPYRSCSLFSISQKRPTSLTETHDGLHSFQDSTIRYNTLKERKTSLQTHCQDTLKTPLDSHRLSENQIRTNNSNRNKKQQHPNTQQPPLYPQYLSIFKIPQCLLTHRSLLLRSA